VLALVHENGSEVFVRLTPGEDPASRRAELMAMLAGRVADLVAHSAQFETEVLLAHGVAVDIDCTLLAAKALYLVAVPEDAPQPVEFGLADLVEREFGRTRDKTIRNRDWRLEESLDAEAIEYGLQDARDCLALWQLYRGRLEAEGLLEGYQAIVRATLPTAQVNLRGMEFDGAAHTVLVGALQSEASRLEHELTRICYGRVANPASTAQISTWIIETVLETAIARPVEPRLIGLLEFLRQRGGLRLDPGGELRARDLPAQLVSLAGMSLEDAAVAAWEAGYVGLEHSRFDPDAGRPEECDLLAAIDLELHGQRVLPLEDQPVWDGYLAECERFDRLHRDDPELFASFSGRLEARCGVTWRRTKDGHLKITKQLKPKMAEALAAEFPMVSEYLIAHAQWTKATKLLGTFGESLAGWVDGDGRLRGGLRMAGTVTMRHSASRPNTQQLPREAEFRGLFRAPPGRALIVCDYDQVELRVLAIVARDEALLAVYREGRDVHSENAAIVGLERKLAKGVSFGIAYGAGPSGLAEAAGISLEKAADALERFLTAYPAVARYREEAPREAEAAGCIAIRPGRRVHYDPALSRATQAINFVIQGGCASVMMRALRRVYDALAARPELGAHLVGAIHDEILLEAPLGGQAEAVAELLQEQMRLALIEIFPEAVEMGADRLAAAKICSSWAEK
jgi:DNA polymerase I-like protein with 3'-5' exonuclease and polymerase domains